VIIVLPPRAQLFAAGSRWKVAGRHAWLWVFTSVGLTVKAIDRRRSHEGAERMLGPDFAGMLRCDCFLAHAAVPYRQHTCTGHLQGQADKTGAARGP
jgi:hypothetical protein